MTEDRRFNTPIRALVFDVDGVLVRSGVFAEILEREHGLDLDATAGFFRGPFVDCLLGRADLKQAIEPFLHAWEWPGSVEDCLRVWFEADSVTNSKLLELIAALRADGVPCHVASTQESYRATYLEDVVGFGSLFDGLSFSCHVGLCKPDPAFFDHVSRSIDASVDELLFFDDMEANVTAAQASGWNAELYRWGDDIRPRLRERGLVG